MRNFIEWDENVLNNLQLRLHHLIKLLKIINLPENDEFCDTKKCLNKIFKQHI